MEADSAPADGACSCARLFCDIAEVIQRIIINLNRLSIFSKVPNSMWFLIVTL